MHIRQLPFDTDDCKTAIVNKIKLKLIFPFSPLVIPNQDM